MESMSARLFDAAQNFADGLHDESRHPTYARLSRRAFLALAGLILVAQPVHGRREGFPPCAGGDCASDGTCINPCVAAEDDKCQRFAPFTTAPHCWCSGPTGNHRQTCDCFCPEEHGGLGFPCECVGELGSWEGPCPP